VSKTYAQGANHVSPVREFTHTFRGPLLHALIGPSGSGKTTLLHLIAGLERPTDGQITVLGKTITDLSRDQLVAFRRQWLAIIPQGPALIEHLTVRENIALALAVGGTSPRMTLATVLGDVGLQHLTDRRAAELSGGERQRLAIARALAVRPAVLLAGECTANLDQATAIAIAKLLAQVAHDHQILVICATHDPSVIKEAHSTTALRSGAEWSAAGQADA
jgi:putative ABC transport system ATP-binding protein